ncbi:MAG: preprotein translocase subunit YajC [Bacteroidota bacterium]|nr:preprotein translocase subunit YajC [Bacteroidota bacterium]
MFITILLQSNPSTSMYANLIFIGLIVVVFYFFMLRPQQKKQKEQKLFRESLKVGDKIVTIGGAHGKIVELTNDNVTIDIDRGVKVMFEKSSISDELSKKYYGQPPVAKS